MKSEPKPVEPEFNERNGMHLCACKIAVGGDQGTIVTRDLYNNPVPWHEIAVLKSLHGEDNVFDIRPVTLVQRPINSMQENQRLMATYGTEEVKQVYPGRTPNFEWFVPGWPLDPTTVKSKETAPRKYLLTPQDAAERV